MPKGCIRGSALHPRVNTVRAIEEKITMKTSVTVVIESDGEQFHAFCPGLPGIHSNAPTVEEARDRTIPAIERYLDYLDEQGGPNPVWPGLETDAGGEIIHLLTNPAESTIQSVEVPWPSDYPR